ncbi:MAG: transglycosylase SLT domain-containing protein, partial [Syntrophobacteraceae bacterium]
MSDMAFDFSAFPEAEKPGPLKVMPFDFSVFPEAHNRASRKEMPFDFSAFPEQPKPELSPSEIIPDFGEQSGYAPAPFVTPPVPADLLRENAPQIEQDVWNISSAPPTIGPLRDQPLRPDVSYATGIRTNLEVGLRRGFNWTVSNLLSLPGAINSVTEQGRSLQAAAKAVGIDISREYMFNATFEAMNKALQVDKLAPPQDFADSLARGIGESGAPLIETMALSYLTAGVLSPLTEGIVTKVPYLYSWLFPIARDAVTFGTQSAMDPGATVKSTEMGAGTGALLGFLGPYGRLTRAIGGAALGVGQEYAMNPQAQLTDYARNAALMGTFAAIGGAHGITPDEAAMFTIIDWAKAKGYSPEVLEQTIKAQGIGPIANEFAEDVTVPIPRIVGDMDAQWLQSLDFPKRWTPDRKDWDALLPFIDAASGKYDVPANIVKAIVWKESNYNPDTVYGNIAGAPGDSSAMKLIPETAMAMGVGDVLDPAQNIDRGTEYLRSLYDGFGDWGKAVAAYNSGAASRLFADNPEAKVEDAPNYSAYVKPVLDAAENFGIGGKPAPDIASADVWARRERTAPSDPYGRFIANSQRPMVGERQGEYVKLTETPEFKDWFGDSKVAFKEGESDYFQNPEGISGIPRMVYHGTGPKNTFEIFRPDERGAIWFRNDQTTAADYAGRGSAVIPAFLKIENPLEIQSTDAITMGDAIDKAKAQGNDGVILDRGHGDYTYAVFSPDQVKSPIVGTTFSTPEVDTRHESVRSDTSDAEESKDVRKEDQRPGWQREQPTAETECTIAKAFAEIEIKPIQLINLPVRSYVDLAVLAQGWRNPHYEELRYVFIKDGVIVDHEGVTCMHPGYSMPYWGDAAQFIAHIRERIEALGPTALYMIHNHPSGNPKPSEADIKATNDIARLIPQLVGHIIINSGEFAYIDAISKRYGVFPLPNLPKDWVDPIIHPSIPHELLGREADTIQHIAGWAKALTRDRDVPVLVYIDSDFKVRGLQEIHPQSFTDIQLMRDRMPQKLVDFGSIGAVAVLPK